MKLKLSEIFPLAALSAIAYLACLPAHSAEVGTNDYTAITEWQKTNSALLERVQTLGYQILVRHRNEASAISVPEVMGLECLWNFRNLLSIADKTVLVSSELIGVSLAHYENTSMETRNQPFKEFLLHSAKEYLKQAIELAGDLLHEREQWMGRCKQSTMADRASQDVLLSMERLFRVAEPIYRRLP